ncbi:MAG: hypothetical protein ACRDJ1_08050 [Actinomycetota bacterium]
MARVRWLAVVVVLLAVTVPSGASTSSQTVGCSGSIAPGGSASCVSTFRIPHFNPGDTIDDQSLVAHIVSPQAFSWRVHAKISDAKGKTYFAWECSARRSVVAGKSTAYFDRTCESWRKLTKDGSDYYAAKTWKPQTLRVTAWVGGCAGECRFEAAATYLFSD